MKARYEKYEKMMRPKDQKDDDDDDGFYYDRSPPSSPPGYQIGKESERNKLKEDPLISAMNAEYQVAMKEVNVTSEQRVKNTLSNLKRVFTEFKIPSGDHQRYYDMYLEKMIAEKRWKGVTVSNVIFHSISSSSKPFTSKDAPEKDYHCPSIMCCLVYPAKKYTCYLCTSRFTTLADRYVHEWQEHGRLNQTEFQCDVSNCRQVFYKNPLALKTHYYSKHLCASEHGECMFGCKALVPQETSTSLAQHYFAVHACEICNDLLSTTLNDHIAAFHGQQQSSKKYQDLISREKGSSSSSHNGKRVYMYLVSKNLIPSQACLTSLG